MSPPRESIDAALLAIDRVSDEDPTRVNHEGSEVGAALLYAIRMSACLTALVPDASVALRLAVRAQHLGRFRLPRKSYPEGRIGYLAWRAEQSKRHAALAEEIIVGAGLGQELGERVASIVQKKRRISDPEAQVLEDCACLVFLEHELEAFAWPTGGTPKSDEELIPILRKTWAKMSELAREKAIRLTLSPRASELLARALVAH